MKTNKKTLQAKYLSIISLYYSIFSAYSHLQTKIYDLRNTKKGRGEMLYLYYHLK